MAIAESQDSRSQDGCDIDDSPLVGRARSFGAVGHGPNLRKRMATIRGWGRFVTEGAASIVYLPGGSDNRRTHIMTGPVSALVLTTSS